MAHAEHPLVAADRAHAAPDLVGQGLEAQGLVGGGQGAGDGVAGAESFLDRAKLIDRLFEPPAQEPRIALERHQGLGVRRKLGRQVVAIDGGQKEGGPHPLVEVFALAAEGIQCAGGVAQGGHVGRAAETIQ